MPCHRRVSILAAVLLLATVSVFAPASWARSYKTLHKFTSGRNGNGPGSALIADQAGNLYGTTGSGGTNSAGTVFKLVPGSDGRWSETVLHRFNFGKDGAHPAASLIFDQVGNLYGTTVAGGPQDIGTVFRLSPNSDGSWKESVLHSFTGGDGWGPLASLIFDQAGNLYGTTEAGGISSFCPHDYGCGTVFKLAPNSDGSWSESVLYNFCSLKSCRDGSNPYTAGLVFDPTGKLYGVTAYGGSLTQCTPNGGCGVVFQLTPQTDGSWKESVLHTFCSVRACRDGVYPLSSLIFDHAGSLYGTTEASNAGGVVFQLTATGDGSWKEKVLHNFEGGNDGSYAISSPTFDHAGNLYGTTVEGGSRGVGVVFKLEPNSKGGWRETVLHSFQGHPGALPRAGVIFDAEGNLYGTTYGGFKQTLGSVFEITP